MTVEIREEALPSRAHTPARVAPTRIGTAARRVGSSTTAATGRVAGLASRYAATDDAWSEVPMSVREVLEYTRSGEWVPGDQAPLLEAFGKAYGYCVAFPVTLLGLAAVWTAQKPTRLLLVALVAVLGWFASGLIL